MRIIRTQGLTKAEFEAIRIIAKRQLPYISMRYHTQKYCYGSIDMRPIKRIGKWQLSPAEVDAVIDFCTAFGLADLPSYFDSPYRHSLYIQGMNYLSKIVSIIDIEGEQ